MITDINDIRSKLVVIKDDIDSKERELAKSKQTIAKLVREETLKLNEQEKVTLKGKVKDVV